MKKCNFMPLIVLFLLPAMAMGGEGPLEHFATGEMRASLSWDSISAMETKVLRFGASMGIHVANGLEVGFEQQFVVPPKDNRESRSWGYVRVVPFRSWVVSPFVAARAGYYNTSDRNAVGLGAGVGAVVFIDKHFAFEASFFTQGVFSQGVSPANENELETRVIIFF